MENNFLLTDEMLWDYADGFLSEGEKLQVEAYLQQHPEQRSRMDAVMAEKSAFLKMSLEKPRTGFSDRVMAAWVSEQHIKVPEKARDWVVSAIAGGFLLVLTVMAVCTIALSPSMEPVSLPEVPVVDWAGMFDSPAARYALMLVLAFLGLQILDKYLQQRNRVIAH